MRLTTVHDVRNVLEKCEARTVRRRRHVRLVSVPEERIRGELGDARRELAENFEIRTSPSARVWIQDRSKRFADHGGALTRITCPYEGVRRGRA